MWIGLCSLYSKFFHLAFCGYRFFDQFGHQIVFLASSHLSLSMKRAIVSLLVLCVYMVLLYHGILFSSMCLLAKGQSFVRCKQLPVCSVFLCTITFFGGTTFPSPVVHVLKSVDLFVQFNNELHPSCLKPGSSNPLICATDSHFSSQQVS
jgi:hypothetical protein